MSLRHAALGLLARQPASGYDLLKQFREPMATMWRVSQSQLYGELARMAGTGLIELSDVGPRGRKEYTITDAGRAEFLRWMMLPPDGTAIRGAAVLRVLFLDQLSGDQARRYLDSLRDFAHRTYSDCSNIYHSPEWADGYDDFHHRAALNYVLASTSMQIAWATWVIDSLDRQTSESPAVYR